MWLAASLMLIFSTAASAVTFIVNSSADEQHVDIDPAGGNQCNPAGVGPEVQCTLRAAIQAANANPGPDEITFDVSGDVRLTNGASFEDFSAGGDLDIRCSASGCEGEKLTITGAGAVAKTVIEAMGLPDRAFDIVDDIVVTIRNIEIRNTNSLFNIGDGTAIRNNGTLTLRNVTVRDSVGFVGTISEAAILNSNTLVLTDVRVEGNTGNGINAGPGVITATGLAAIGNSAAGIHLISTDAMVSIKDSQLSGNAIGFWAISGHGVIEDTEISGNSSFDETGFPFSGGVLNGYPFSLDDFPLPEGVLDQSFLTIERCQISGNNSRATGGGGLRNLITGTLELLDSQIMDNVVDVSAAGGGLANSGRAVVRRSLFTNNTAVEGGGIANTGTLMVVNTTVSGNPGGGISSQNFGLNAALRVESSTLVDNFGVDLHQTAAAYLIDVRNSIVSFCLESSSAPIIRSFGFNFERGESCGFVETGDVQNITDLLGGIVEKTLADNGGFTQTHRLLNLLPADPPPAEPVPTGIDTYDGLVCPRVDQRGMPRLFGSCDVGAYEDQPETIVSECNDRVDNDGDGDEDVAGCNSSVDNLEMTLTAKGRLATGTILAASDDGVVFAINPQYPAALVTKLPPLLARGSGLAGPISVTGGSEIFVLDALQGLVFQIDLETGLPSLFSSTGELEFPLDIEYGPDGDLFVVGRVAAGSSTIVRIDPVTRAVTTLSIIPPLSNVQSIDIDANGKLLVSTRTAGAMLVEFDDLGQGLVEQVGSNLVDASGLEIRRTGDLLVVDRETRDVVEQPVPTGAKDPIGIPAMALESPRGLAIESETEPGTMPVEVKIIVSERNGSLHRIVWDGADTATFASIFDPADDQPSLFGLWILRDLDADGILDADEVADGLNPLDADSDADGIDDPDELAGVTDPINPDTDGDGLNDGDEIVEGTDPLDPDSDDDTFNDGDEVAAGTLPNDPDSHAFFPRGIPAVGPHGIWILAPGMLLASRFLFRRR